jgi:hypothetical protein
MSDADRHVERRRTVGTLAAMLGFPAAGFLALLTILSANACGMFADGCSDYGKTAPGFGWYAAGTVVAGVLAVAGLIVAIEAATEQRRRRSASSRSGT